jgi:hypothetical protein
MVGRRFKADRVSFTFGGDADWPVHLCAPRQKDLGTGVHIRPDIATWLGCRDRCTQQVVGLVVWLRWASLPCHRLYAVDFCLFTT